MAEATAKSVLGEISQKHLECPICFCRFKDPKILDCLHSFCLNCLDELVCKQDPKTDKITCPVCRKVTAVPDSGLRDLANCFFINSLIDEVSKQERLLEAASLPTVKCDECDEGLEASSRCLDCDENICQICQAAHERSKHTKKHRIVKVDSLQQQDVTSSTSVRKPDTPKCKTHPSQELYFYCDTCKMLICGICAATDHRRAEPKFSEIADAIKSYRAGVKEIMQKFEKSKDEFKVANDVINHARNRLKMMTTRACRDISTKEEEEIAKIRNKARLLKEKVNQISRKKDDELAEVLGSNRDKMDRAERIAAAVNDLMQQADDFELLELKPKVMHNLAFQEELQFEPPQHGLSFIGVQSYDVVREDDLGRILHEEMWQLKKTFGKEGSQKGEFQWAKGVGCFSNGDIAVMDRRNKNVGIFTSTGVYKADLEQSGEDGKLNKPFGLAVTKDDSILIIDGKTLKVLTIIDN